MQSSNSTITAPPKSVVGTVGRRVDARAILALVTVGLLWFMLCRHLSSEWSVNEQYSYGWFVPFFALFLFWLRWEHRPTGAGGVDGTAAKGSGAEAGLRQHQDRPRLFEANVQRPTSNIQRSTRDKAAATRSSALTVATCALFLLLPIRLFEVGNPDWRPLGWAHAAVVVGLTMLVIWRAGGLPWVWHFAFPVMFMLVAVPWITPIEAPIIQGLMGIVAAVATETLNLLGVPAQLEGSLIRVNTGLVGVNEACSGVRSLQTSLMIGLLFGELKRLSVRRRIALLAGALAIALVANFARAFTLVWVSATDAPAAAERWHDPLGYAIVGLVFVGSMALAALLGRGGKGESEKEKVEDEGTAQPPRADDRESPTPNRRSLPSPFYFLLALLWLFIVEGGVELWYRSHERNLVARQPWTVRYPEGAPGFREVDISEDVKRTLRFDEGRQVSWKAAPIPNNGSPITNNRVAPATAFLFFFRWEPGTATILRARSHRPDICLPNVGWRQIEDHGVRDYSLGGDLQLPFRHFTFIREVAGQRPMFAESFFCMREDKVQPVSSGSAPFDLVQDARTSDWMPADRVRVVLEGLRNPGQQVMQFLVLSPQQMSGVEAEAQFRELLPQIVAVGGK